MIIELNEKQLERVSGGICECDPNTEGDIGDTINNSGCEIACCFNRNSNGYRTDLLDGILRWFPCNDEDDSTDLMAGSLSVAAIHYGCIGSASAA